MKSSLEDKVRQEIKIRALAQAAKNREQKQKRERTRLTLIALQQVTGLSRFELDTIAADVRTSFELRQTDFFSIKRQALVVFTAFGLLTVGVWLLMAWMF